MVPDWTLTTLLIKYSWQGLSITKVLCERSSGHPSYPSITRNYSCYACLENQLCNRVKAVKCSFFQFVSCIENISSQKDLGNVCSMKCYPSKWPRWPLWVLHSSRASSQVIHTLWHSAPGTRAPGHKHHSCQLWAHGAAHPLLTAVSPAWEYTKTCSSRHCCLGSRLNRSSGNSQPLGGSISNDIKIQGNCIRSSG